VNKNTFNIILLKNNFTLVPLKKKLYIFFFLTPHSKEKVVYKIYKIDREASKI